MSLYCRKIWKRTRVVLWFQYVKYYVFSIHASSSPLYVLTLSAMVKFSERHKNVSLIICVLRFRNYLPFFISNYKSFNVSKESLWLIHYSHTCGIASIIFYWNNGKRAKAFVISWHWNLKLILQNFIHAPLLVGIHEEWFVTSIKGILDLGILQNEIFAVRNILFRHIFKNPFWNRSTLNVSKLQTCGFVEESVLNKRDFSVRKRQNVECSYVEISIVE